MQFQSLKRTGLISTLAFTLITAGCAGMSTTDRRVGTGVGIGAVTGALITGSPGGTAVGAVLGGAGGWLYDREKKKRYYYRNGRRYYER